MRETDHAPRMACVIAAITAATGIQRPGAGVKSIGVAGINEDVGNHVVLASADAADQLPMSAFIVGKENVAVGSTEVHFLDVVGIGFEGYYCATRRAYLTPSLRRR